MQPLTCHPMPLLRTYAGGGVALANLAAALNAPVDWRTQMVSTQSGGYKNIEKINKTVVGLLHTNSPLVIYSNNKNYYQDANFVHWLLSGPANHNEPICHWDRWCHQWMCHFVSVGQICHLISAQLMEWLTETTSWGSCLATREWPTTNEGNSSCNVRPH